jgi:hypothetical protein
VRSILEDWEKIDLYVRTIRPPRAPTNLVAADVTAGAALFAEGSCAGCHGSATGTNLWTVSRRFYVPNETHNAVAGTLRSQTYTGFPTMFAGLNPPSSNTGRTGPFRISLADSTALGSGDQINCVLRSVGTIGGTQAAPTAVAPADIRAFIFEIKAANGMAAQGFQGFNPPSLVGMGTGAPYFHAGNARTLEEALSDLFRTHHQAFNPNFLLGSADAAVRAASVRQLAAFLVSIDDQTTAVPFPTISGVTTVDLCTGFTASP